jgi:hypothetical protein
VKTAARRREHAAGRRKPLVLSASREAIDAAAQLGIGQLENRTTAAIAREDLVFGGGRGRVNLGGGIVAVCERVRSPVSGRRAWRVLSVERRAA